MKHKSIRNIIAEHFLNNPTARLRVRHIERELKVSLPSTIRAVNELVSEGILKTTEVAKARLYSADRASNSYLLEKRLHNIRQLQKSGLIEFLVSEYDNPPIILFGSYSRGQDVETSDIDLFIQSNKKQVPLAPFEKKLEHPIHLFITKNLQSVENKELTNNIVNGITLNGFIEVFR